MTVGHGTEVGARTAPTGGGAPDPGVQHPTSGPGRVVCGVNGSTSSRHALAEALRRASPTGGRVTVVTAVDDVGHYWGALAALPGGELLPVPHRREGLAAEEAVVREFVDEVLSDDRLVPAAARGSVGIDIRVVPGLPVDVLVRESAGATALVVGHSEDEDPLTSVALGCSRRARCPVVVVPLGDAPDDVRS
ncbi:universal stress protein [Actinomycetospora cinnamomea]|uniref:Nucleotide-binding universal stress UspA family protein n=1 Tax=Actinomycetospora cinnamomea TaxID=663609 RepID=A0A2U1F261_9PSEU|nr:universal stress protein [Actinomycetospora cinnamomea]PVZ06273.1 nucleotide-binding universal stress UspA family protein [Actinomycetospora cinnamomea]